MHQLPGVREALLAALRQRYAAQEMPWVRSTAPAHGLWRGPKAGAIALLGGWTATRRLGGAGVRVNRGSGVVYAFNAPDAAASGAWMAQWLAQLGDGGLLMCQPAVREPPGDAIGRQRPVEFAYLSSEAFGALLAQQRPQVARGPLRPLLR